MIDDENQRALQRIFNKAVRHCVRQGKRCMTDESDVSAKNCSYYENGQRCAIGGAVDVETAKMLEQDFYGDGVGDEDEPREVDVVVCDALGISPTTDNLEFLSELQGAHDNADNGNLTFEESFLIKAGRVAEEFHLTMPTIS